MGTKHWIPTRRAFRRSWRMIEQQSSRASFTFGASESITANLSFSNNMNANEFYEWITFSRASLVEYISNSPSSSSHSFSSFFFVDNFTACECFFFISVVSGTVITDLFTERCIIQIGTHRLYFRYRPLRDSNPGSCVLVNVIMSQWHVLGGKKEKKIEDHILTPTTCRSLPFKIIIKNTVGTVDIVRYLLPLTQYHSF